MPINIHKTEECFEILERYSFVEWKEDQQSYTMHKLVHAWGYNRLTEDEQRKFGIATFDLVVAAVNGYGNVLEDRLRLVPYLMANFTGISNSSAAPNQVAEDTLNKLGMIRRFLTDIGQLRNGGEIEQFVLNERRRILGEEHPNTIKAIGNLVTMLGDLSKLDEAAKMKKEVLKKRRRILGEEHPDTITAMNNLVVTLGDLGQLDEAAKMSEEVLEKRRRILGDEHLDTISAINNLVNRLRDLG
jgi:tetratricopeptide (TPR) repeat protein